VSSTVGTAHARLSALARHRGAAHPDVLAARRDLEAAKLQQVIEKAEQARIEARMQLAALQGGDDG
jgi:hypothetical protein